MPLHAERRRVGSRAWSNRFTLLVGEEGFPCSIPPTNPVGFPLVLPTWREGGETRSATTLTLLMRGPTTRDLRGGETRLVATTTIPGH